ncbi:MAG: hypothetical protein LZF60_340166 [Nitrospira sp.]|nr:MAG: hypothetical protein LZF60_340166 [Nitrospira sp.]
MARRSSEQAERATKQERWNRWRCLLRNPKFQTAVNQLRSEYRDWVIGPPLSVGVWDGEDLVETKIARVDIDLHSQAIDHREEPFLLRWGAFEYEWRIKFPKQALTDRLSSLSYLTVEEWQRLWGDSSDIMPPAVTLIDAGCTDRPPDTVSLRLDLGHVDGDLLARIKDELRKARLVMPGSKTSSAGKQERKRQDKITDQLRVFDAESRGLSVYEIAKAELRSESTIKSMLQAIRKRIGSEKPHHGKAWYGAHVKTCPICNEIGIPSSRCASVAARMTKEAQIHEARTKEFQRTFIPPGAVASEKSAFGKWDAVSTL